ncbi:MAG TPA: DUF3822 family protein [Puia sp.]|jgi:hypothetical protein|nr:DUF3822 family protein [Puia sp.]
MLQPSFHIEADNIETENFQQCRLVVVVDTDSLSYVIMTMELERPLCIKYFQFNQINDRQQEEIMREIIFEDELLTKDINETFVVYNVPDSTLVPDAFFDEQFNREFVNLIYGNLNKSPVMSEKVPWWDIYNVYRLPSDLHKLLQNKFPSAKHWHFYSLLLKSYKKFNVPENAQTLQVLFCPEKIIVSVYKNGRLLLMQNFLYSIPEDVLYHLLNCCMQLDMSRQVVKLQLSGFIETQSLIYSELVKYFSDVSFSEPEESIAKSDMLKKYPLHYFSSLLKMAACV